MNENLQGIVWRWACDICGQLLDVRAAGTSLCPSCGCPYTVEPRARGELFSSGVSAVPLSQFAPLPGSACAGHPEAPAAGACERCGDFVCAGCSRFRQGRRYCPACVRTLRGQGAAENRRKSMTVLYIVGALYLLYFLVMLLAGAFSGR